MLRSLIAKVRDELPDEGGECPVCHGRGFLPPVKVCANDTCNRGFRWQTGRAEQGQYKTAGVMYCSDSCARAQAQREYRKRNR